jgi:hypothetical protein
MPLTITNAGDKNSKTILCPNEALELRTAGKPQGWITKLKGVFKKKK